MLEYLGYSRLFQITKAGNLNSQIYFPGVRVKDRIRLVVRFKIRVRDRVGIKQVCNEETSTFNCH